MRRRQTVEPAESRRASRCWQPAFLPCHVFFASICQSLHRVTLWCTTLGAQRSKRTIEAWCTTLGAQLLVHNVWCKPLWVVFFSPRLVVRGLPPPTAAAAGAFGTLCLPRCAPTAHLLRVDANYHAFPHPLDMAVVATPATGGNRVLPSVGTIALPPSPLRACYPRLEHGADHFPLRVDTNHMHFRIRGT